ncbi:MAG: hypothetical protein FWF52_04325 [Candidatus Azobacteroides sp.]|nr:hypothetical protein [Candidatus Azobacteroides sp.]
MKYPTKTNAKKKAMLNALKQTLGVVTPACENAGIDRTTHYKWMKEDECYKNIVEDIENIALDFAESRLHINIKNGDVASILFYLKTRGKKRGYIEQQKMDVTSNGKDFNTCIQVEIIDSREKVMKNAEDTDNENIQ